MSALADSGRGGVTLFERGWRRRGGHGVAGPAVRRLERAFLERGLVEGLDLSEVERLRLPPLVHRGD